MSDELAQFFIGIYELCLSAELARVCVDIHTRSGARAVGVPTVVDACSGPGTLAEGNSELVLIEIDGNEIALDQIDWCAIVAPQG